MPTSGATGSALVGWSLGGFWVPRAAAFEKPRAGVAWDANHNWGEVQKKWRVAHTVPKGGAIAVGGAAGRRMLTPAGREIAQPVSLRSAALPGGQAVACAIGGGAGAGAAVLA